MNDKHPALVALIDRVMGDLTPRQAVIVDHWTTDSVAIGIARPDDLDHLVYVALDMRDDGRGGLEVEPDMYYYEREMPGAHSALGHEAGAARDRVTYDELIDSIRHHLLVGSAKSGG